jgi:pyruvate,water dikinase
MSYVLRFDEVGRDHIGHVGGKGANLGEMVAAGLPVPPGFCVTARAYRHAIQAADLSDPIQEILRDLTIEDRDKVDQRSAQIRALIEQAPIPSEIEGPVVESYRWLGEQLRREAMPVAVRSSATAEDLPGASFAGQQDTYLNIRGDEQLLEHVRRCWASLWTERAVTYRTKQGFDHGLVHLCVVVQAMIDAEVSGILFTANPISGNRAEAVINASWGLGESIVSGLVDPDTITVDRTRKQVVSRQAGTKEMAIVYGKNGGTVEVETSEAQRAEQALSDEQALELAEWGERIEAHYDAPQDIEWGYAEGKWYMLQARPITTLTEDDEYNRTMFVDIFPDALSPVFLAVIERLFSAMLDFSLRYMGFKPPDDIPPIGAFYNQPYFNRSYIEQAFAPLSPKVRIPLVAGLVNPFSPHEQQAPRELSLPYIRMMSNVLKFMIRFPKLIPGLLAEYHANVAYLANLDMESHTDEQIVQAVRKLVYEDASRLLNYDYLMISVMRRTYELLGTLLFPTFGEDTDEWRTKLVSGVTGNVTMETNLRIWDLAQVAKQSPEASQILRESELKDVRVRLEKEPNAEPFLRELDRFLAEFGHREVRMDILYPTWVEDPAPILGFVRGYLDSDESQSPHLHQDRLVSEREEITDRALARLRQSVSGRLLRAPLFRWILEQTQEHTRERDTMHFELTRLFPPARRAFIELGRRWKEAGLFERVDDIYYVTLDEMLDLARSPQPVRELIHGRREEFEDSKQRPWPNVVRGDQEIYPEGATPDSGDGDLRGIAGSPGVIRGPARLVRSPEEFDRLKKGDILVAPMTNPVWTPLFAIASGVITEVGGILSHGAIVAREYGIPAVMSVPGVTKLLSDGQQVTVDGDHGVVLLEQ